MTNGVRDDWPDDNWIVGALLSLFLLAGVVAYAFNTGDRWMVASALDTTVQTARPTPPTAPN